MKIGTLVTAKNNNTYVFSDDFSATVTYVDFEKICVTILSGWFKNKNSERKKNIGYDTGTMPIEYFTIIKPKKRIKLNFLNK